MGKGVVAARMPCIYAALSKREHALAMYSSLERMEQEHRTWVILLLLLFNDAVSIETV